MSSSSADPEDITAPLEADGLRARSFKTPRTVIALMLREMSTTYGRSPGGYLWAVLEPVGAVGMFTLIVAVGLKIRQPSIGVSFPLFFATGILPFLMYNKIAGKVSTAVTFSKALLSYPGVTFADAVMGRFILNALTQVMVFYLVMTGILWGFETRAILDFGPIVLGLTMAMMLALGIGALNCYLIPTFPVWASLWGILTTPLFFLSSIIYTYEDLPQLGRDILWWNPLVHIVGMVRRGFYPTYEATYVTPVYVFAIAFVTLTLGLLLLRRYHREILNR